MGIHHTLARWAVFRMMIWAHVTLSQYFLLSCAEQDTHFYCKWDQTTSLLALPSALMQVLFTVKNHLCEFLPKGKGTAIYHSKTSTWVHAREYSRAMELHYPCCKIERPLYALSYSLNFSFSYLTGFWDLLGYEHCLRPTFQGTFLCDQPVWEITV